MIVAIMMSVVTNMILSIMTLMAIIMSRRAIVMYVDLSGIYQPMIVTIVVNPVSVALLGNSMFFDSVFNGSVIGSYNMFGMLVSD